MKTIEEIKEDCIDIDLQNVDAGDKSIGTYRGEEFIRFRDRHDIELFYSNISLKDLLDIYSEYNGLKDYKSENPKDYKESYSIDVLDILENL